MSPSKLSTLWQLTWNDSELSCTIYREGDRLELRLESATATIIAEPFDLRPRAMARATALRRSLERRGWTVRDAPCKP